MPRAIPSKPCNDDKQYTIRRSEDSNAVVVYLHDGGHEFAGKYAVAAMVRFVKEHPKQ